MCPVRVGCTGLGVPAMLESDWGGGVTELSRICSMRYGFKSRRRICFVKFGNW